MVQGNRHQRLARTLVVACLFLAMQIAAASHAATYGNAPHSHDGAPCLNQLVTDGSATVPCAASAPIDWRNVSMAGLSPSEDGPSTISLDHCRAIRAPPALSL
jgi:hypothetical protein